MHSLIFYFSYLSFPFLLFLIYILVKKRKSLKSKFKLLTTIFLILITLSFIYARFIERNLITTKTTDIEVGFNAKIVVISDIHLGVYKDDKFLEKVVEKINEIENVDAVLIPGDFTYYPPENLQNLEELFYPLKDLKVPTYGILGNHDDERPGPPIQEELKKALENNNVIFLENTSDILKNKNIKILGLGDNFAEKDDVTQINNFSKSDNLIVMTHNPDTTLNYTNSIPDLTITGHTHGGQIRLPYFYKKAIPCDGDFDRNLTETNHGKLFISTGIGEVGLPMRLGVPPVIDVLELK